MHQNARRKLSLMSNFVVVRMLSRYEVARIIGLRALQLDEGAVPMVVPLDANESTIITATRELVNRKLRVQVKRDFETINVWEATLPDEPYNLLALMDEC